MNETKTMVVDAGVLGDTALDVIVKYQAGEKGSRFAGRQMDPDYPAQYIVQEIEHPIFSNKGNHFYLTRLYHNDAGFRAIIDSELDEILAAEQESAEIERGAA